MGSKSHDLGHWLLLEYKCHLMLLVHHNIVPNIAVNDNAGFDILKYSKHDLSHLKTKVATKTMQSIRQYKKNE